MIKYNVSPYPQVITWDKEAVWPGESVEVDDEVGVRLSPVDWSDTPPVAPKVDAAPVAPVAPKVDEKKEPDEKKEVLLADKQPNPPAISTPEAQEDK